MSQASILLLESTAGPALQVAYITSAGENKGRGKLRTMKTLLALFVVCFVPAALAAFGVTRSGNNYLVDSGAGLVTTSNQSFALITLGFD